MSTHTSLALQSRIKQFWNWGPLLFTGFYLLPTFFNFEQLSVLNITATLLFYCAFIVLYIKAINCANTNVTALFIAMLTACVGASFFTSGTSTLFGFTAYIAGFCFTKTSRLAAGLSVIVGVICSAYIIDLHGPEYFLGVAIILSVALFTFGFAGQKERTYKQREQESAKQLEQLAAIAERERIARDLHDILGHSLSSIALKAELASKLNQAQRYPQANSEIEQVAELARQLLSDVRSAVSDLKQLNISNQVATLMERLKEQGFDVDLHIDINKLPVKVEGIASLIIKEAVTNLLRHSKNKRCAIYIKQSEEQLEINIVNYDLCEKVNKGNGLNGIKERASQLGGLINIETGECFSLNIILPLVREYEVTL
ncbi:sensor histidine kinase [Pseudoalteromonas neustonica]|uniref:sensor histidine kinase n=1 Tax=Pseudoalteromonas neustonica TaxID=1840331 RepID=UPI0007DB379A|nr:sensor histidine kinase [Pseudoalteromonas neustonica]